MSPPGETLVGPIPAGSTGRRCCAWGLALLVGIASPAGLAGCHGLRTNVDPLPSHNTLSFDQLVIYSNFPLPRHHRLLEELRIQRGEMIERLSLPRSDEPIHVYLFDSEGSLASFLERQHPEFPNRRAFFVETDTRLTVYAQWGDRVAEDLRHEVAHGYLHSVVRDVPLWLDEGLAEYFEVPRGHQGLNAPHVQLLLEKLLGQGWRPHLERLESLTVPGEMTQDDYAEAWAWIHWHLESTPERAQRLGSHLARLRDNGPRERLSVTLRESEPQAEQLLVEHLYRLAPQPATSP